VARACVSSFVLLLRAQDWVCDEIALPRSRLAAAGTRSRTHLQHRHDIYCYSGAGYICYALHGLHGLLAQPCCDHAISTALNRGCNLPSSGLDQRHYFVDHHPPCEPVELETVVRRLNKGSWQDDIRRNYNLSRNFSLASTQAEAQIRGIVN